MLDATREPGRPRMLTDHQSVGQSTPCHVCWLGDHHTCTYIWVFRTLRERIRHLFMGTCDVRQCDIKSNTRENKRSQWIVTWALFVREIARCDPIIHVHVSLRKFSKRKLLMINNWCGSSKATCSWQNNKDTGRIRAEVFLLDGVSQNGVKKGIGLLFKTSLMKYFQTYFILYNNLIGPPCLNQYWYNQGVVDCRLFLPLAMDTCCTLHRFWPSLHPPSWSGNEARRGDVNSLLS
jgi:hypothetical protein